MRFQATQIVRQGTIRNSRRVSVLALSAMLALTGCGSGVFEDNAATPVAAANGPQLGYLWVNTDQTLRPILGIPGASQLGQSVVAAGSYQSAVTPASGAFALMQATDGSMDIVTLPAGTAVGLNVTVGSVQVGSGALLRISPSGGAAAIYMPGASSASIVTGLPGKSAVRTVSANAAILDAAVSDTGSVAFEVAQGSNVIANAIGSNGATHTVASLGAGGGMSFLPGQDSLLLADGSANTLVLVAAATNAPATSMVATGTLLKAPVSVGVSASGHWAMIVNGTGNGLVRVDLTQGTSVAVACACTPTVAAPLSYDGAFRVTALTSSPNWVVDASVTAPRVLFIPPLPGAKKASTGTTGATQ